MEPLLYRDRRFGTHHLMGERCLLGSWSPSAGSCGTCLCFRPDALGSCCHWQASCACTALSRTLTHTPEQQHFCPRTSGFTEQVSTLVGCHQTAAALPELRCRTPAWHDRVCSWCAHRSKGIPDDLQGRDHPVRHWTLSLNNVSSLYQTTGSPNVRQALHILH